MQLAVNKVLLIGRLGAAPERRDASGGTTVANASLATSESWHDKQTGERNERTEWHRLVAFGRTAEVMTEYLDKGSQIFVEGKLQTRKWEDREGNDRYTTEVVVRHMQMLDSRRDAGERPARPRPAPQPPEADDGIDDDIPF